MMFDHKAALVASAKYLKEHPEEFLHSARKARHWTFGLPLVALNWVAKEFIPAGGPRDLQIGSSPLGLRVEATVEQMNTQLRASSVIVVDKIALRPDAITLELRLRNVEIRLLDDSAQTPLAALIRSQTLDLSRVASLVAYLPSRPDALVEAVDDRLVIDLMKIPRLSTDTRLRSALAFLSAVLAVEHVRTEGEHIEVRVRPLTRGLVGLVRAKLLGHAS